VADVRQRLAVPPPAEPDFVARVLARVQAAHRVRSDA
jgi:hypothetical protein